MTSKPLFYLRTNICAHRRSAHPATIANHAMGGSLTSTANVAYKLHVPDVKRTGEFSDWLGGLRDIRARAKILARIDRLALGNPGDMAPVGNGVSEMRIHYGPGYRVYFVRRGTDFVVLLCGGDKSSQASDIATAKKLADTLED